MNINNHVTCQLCRKIDIPCLHTGMISVGDERVRDIEKFIGNCKGIVINVEVRTILEIISGN